MMAKANEEHESSMALCDALMFWKVDWKTCGRSPEGLDTCISNVFDTKTHVHVMRCIKMVKVLHDMEKQLDTLELDKLGLLDALDYVFDPSSHQIFEKRVIQWKDLVKTRERMVKMGIETQCIDKKIEKVFIVGRIH